MPSAADAVAVLTLEQSYALARLVHRGEYARVLGAVAAMTATCLWCGTGPAPHVVHGDPLGEPFPVISLGVTTVTGSAPARSLGCVLDRVVGT